MTEAKTLAQLEAIAAKLPMSRKEKLLHFAAVIRSYQGNHANLGVYTGIEYMHPTQLAQLPAGGTLLQLATDDPVFKEAGLSSKDYGGVMNFLELSTTDLHAFACSCYGPLSQDETARRIERIAG